MSEQSAARAPLLPSKLPLPRPPLGPGTWPAWLGIGLLWLLARLPWRLQKWLGRGLGRLLFLALRRRRRIAAINLRVCFPDQDAAWRQALLREHFAALGIGLFEFIRTWWGGVAFARRRLSIEGLELLQAGLAAGRGVILVSGHFTTLEVCGRLLCDHAPVAGMYRPHDSPALEWAVKRGRLRYATAMFGRDELRPALRHLRQGGVLWFAPDQDTLRGDNVFVPFFGEPARSLTSTHQLARMSGAAVLAFRHRRTMDDRYEMVLEPIAARFPTADATADTAHVMAAIERMARAAPEQYLWIHRRFKRRPEGAAPIYD